MLAAIAMLFTSPMPFDAAVDRLESKTAVASNLSSDQWSQIEIGLVDRSFFSAKVNDLGTVTLLQSMVDDALSLNRRDGGAYMDRSRFIAEARSALGASPGDSGKLTDITSSKRLGLIYDFNVEDAMEYGRWQARQDPDILDAFPCNELIRIEHRQVPRGYRRGAKGRLIEVPDESWPARWAAAGGTFVGGRMIARKDDPIWTRISRFGRPWPPFDFNSGMGVADVSRREAEQLGVIDENEAAPKPQHLDFNHKLEASIPKATPEAMQELRDAFGDQIEAAEDGTVAWAGAKLVKLYREALADSEAKWSLDLGLSTPTAIEAARDAEANLIGAELELSAESIRDAGTKEPISVIDAQLIPQVWRDPDQVERNSDGTLTFTKSFLGRTVTVIFERLAGGKWGVASFESEGAA